MGIVEETGADITHLRPGTGSCPVQHLLRALLDVQPRSVRPVRDHPGPQPGQGRRPVRVHLALRIGPGGQAQYLRVPQAQFGPVKVPEGVPDEQYLYLSDILPTAYQAVAYADVPAGGTLAVLGLGPVGQMAARIARHLGQERVIGVDPVPERRAAAERFGAQTLDPDAVDNTAAALIELTGGRGPDAVIDAVGMEAHGHDEPRSTRLIAAGQKATGLLPDSLAAKVSDKAALDRLDALHTAVKAVRRGGTVSVSGVYGGEIDPMPLMEMFDRGVQMRMGQAHVRRWIDDLLRSSATTATRSASATSPLTTCRSRTPRTGTRSSATRRRVASRSSSNPDREPARLTVEATVRSRSKAFFHRTDRGSTEQGTGPRPSRRHQPRPP